MDKTEIYKILNKEKQYWETRYPKLPYEGMREVHGRLKEIERIKRLISKYPDDAYKYVLGWKYV